MLATLAVMNNAPAILAVFVFEVISFAQGRYGKGGAKLVG